MSGIKKHEQVMLETEKKNVMLCLWLQCHGLWDNKEVEMPDFLKKLKKKAEKNRQSGVAKGEKEYKKRRLGFLPLQTSTAKLFFRRKEDSESQGGYNIRRIIACMSTPLLKVNRHKNYLLHNSSSSGQILANQLRRV